MILILGDAAVDAARAARDGRTVELFGQKFTVGSMQITDYHGAKCALVELKNTGETWPEVPTDLLRATLPEGITPAAILASAGIITKE